MTAYTLVDILTGIFEAIMIFLLFDTFCVKKSNYTEWPYRLGILLLSFLINVSNKIFTFGAFNILGMMAAIFIMSFLYDSNIKIRLIISVFGLLLIAIIELIVLYSMTALYDITVADIVESPMLRVHGIVMSKMLAFAIIKIICSKSRTTKIYMRTSYWILFLLIFLNTFLAVFVIYKFTYDSNVVYMNNLSVICSMGLLYTTFFSLFLYEHMATQTEIIQKQQSFEQQITSQAKHLDEILITQKQLRTFRHDIKNHLISISAYFERKDFEGGLNYVKNIDTLANIKSSYLETGNTALDAIINTKKAISESKKIKFVTNIQIPQQISIQASDICIIFGNALDNAIEACMKTNQDDRFIELSIISENNSIICKIANSAPDVKNPFLKTTKHDWINHGFGIENIKTALENYKSYFNIKQENGKFTLSFIIEQ